MAHHKRRRPKHQRAGCLYCKSYKDERAPQSAGDENRRAVDEGLDDLATQPHPREIPEPE